GEGGFSILESTVALVIIFGVLLTLLRTLDTGVRVLVESRRQAAASALANELLERARSLEWENTGLTASTNTDDCPDADPATKDGVACPTWKALLGVAGVGTSSNPYTFEGDVIIFLTEDQTFDPFLSFHQQLTRDDTVFDRFLFVSSIRTDPADATTERYRKLTAIVQWVPPSGFRKEVRQVTHVARFEEPSQPFLQGSVNLDGGSFSISGKVQGTSDFLDPAAARPDLTFATIEPPDAQVSAVTDYVSGASVLGTGSRGEVEWADGHRTLDVATLQVSGADQYEKRADDDFGSAPPENDSSGGPEQFNAWQLTNNAAPHDFAANEENDAGTTLDNTQAEGEAWTEYSGDPLGLPYGGLLNGGLQTGEVLAAGFFEYGGVSTAAYYLKGAGTPEATLSQSAPTASSLPDYDSDGQPGRTLEQSLLGLGETDPLFYQRWITPSLSSGLTINGKVNLRFWSAMSGFDDDDRGVVDAYLLDCDSSGSVCTKIAEGRRDADPWSGGSSTWVESDISLGHLTTYTVPAGRRLAVKLVVAVESEDSMLFAYDTTDHPSRLGLTQSISYSGGTKPYTFELIRAGEGTGPLLEYSGYTDRYETSVSTRRVDVGFGWDGDGQQVFLGRDTAYDDALGASRLFLGWIRVDLPKVGGELSAGEAAAAPAWDPSGSAWNLTVSYWDPTAGAGGKGAYVTPAGWSIDYRSMIDGTPFTLDFDTSPADGATDSPFDYLLSVSGFPRLEYRVRATLTVNPPTTSETLDGNGDRAEVVLQAAGIVTGTFEYYVEDTLAGEVLYDVDVGVNLGGVTGTARYINPGAP
ncbi:MAG: hypothetical protein ACRDVM_00270, partial [Acidimicrobiia bacterium]